PYFHADCATVEELIFYLQKWSLKKYRRFPILYLAFHGSENGIWLGKKFFSLKELSSILANKCLNRIIVLAACGTLNINKKHLNLFLAETQALAICGYRLTVPWIESTAFELIMLAAMQDNNFDGRGVNAIQKKLIRNARMFNSLEFRMITRREIPSLEIQK
ncbi:MAG: hypothetical protein JW784_04035, partial [Candidatus Cloacimonetes bacterium]|nr:hypothetical protein [Candidatus Cloacimonadota bacterium]